VCRTCLGKYRDSILLKSLEEIDFSYSLWSVWAMACLIAATRLVGAKSIHKAYVAIRLMRFNIQEIPRQ
jgi:hypothetical protein